MNISEFEIKEPSDLNAFHDLLEESGFRQWAGTVRRMIKENRWPAKVNYPTKGKGYRWDLFHPRWLLELHRKSSIPDNILYKGPNRYKTLNDAVWAIVVSGRFLEEDDK